jgi:hypothetical protein
MTRFIRDKATGQMRGSVGSGATAPTAARVAAVTGVNQRADAGVPLHEVLMAYRADLACEGLDLLTACILEMDGTAAVPVPPGPGRWGTVGNAGITGLELDALCQVQMQWQGTARALLDATWARIAADDDNDTAREVVLLAGLYDLDWWEEQVAQAYLPEWDDQPLAGLVSGLRADRAELSEPAQELIEVVLAAEQHAWRYSELMTVVRDFEDDPRMCGLVRAYMRAGRYFDEAAAEVHDVRGILTPAQLDTMLVFVGDGMVPADAVLAAQLV